MDRGGGGQRAVYVCVRGGGGGGGDYPMVAPAPHQEVLLQAASGTAWSTALLPFAPPQLWSNGICTLISLPPSVSLRTCRHIFSRHPGTHNFLRSHMLKHLRDQLLPRQVEVRQHARTGMWGAHGRCVGEADRSQSSSVNTWPAPRSPYSPTTAAAHTARSRHHKTL